MGFVLCMVYVESHNEMTMASFVFLWSIYIYSD